MLICLAIVEKKNLSKIRIRKLIREEFWSITRRNLPSLSMLEVVIWHLSPWGSNLASISLYLISRQKPFKICNKPKLSSIGQVSLSKFKIRNGPMTIPAPLPTKTQNLSNMINYDYLFLSYITFLLLNII